MTPEGQIDADFRVLGLEPGSKQAEVKRAYRTLAKRWHPDRHHSKPYETRALAEEKFRQIDEAYRRISRSWRKRAEQPAKEPQAAPSEPARPPAADPLWKTLAKQLKWKIPTGVAPVFVAVIALLLIYEVSSVLLDYYIQEPGTVPPRTSVEKIPQGTAPGADSLSIEEVDPGALPSATILVPVPVPSVPLVQPPPKPPGSFFTIGSTPLEVERIQGAPSRVSGQTWFYGLSEVQFRNGRVWRYNNFDNSLRVRLIPFSPDGEQKPDYFTLGSTENEVLLAQGTPTRVEPDKWYYGFSEVRFKDGRVKEYDNYFGSLKVRLAPSAPQSPDTPQTSFTIGSTPDEVLAVQGTPTSIQGNHWSFNFSSVFFRDGRVQFVSNADGSLRYASPDEGSDSGP